MQVGVSTTYCTSYNYIISQNGLNFEGGAQAGDIWFERTDGYRRRESGD